MSNVEVNKKYIREHIPPQHQNQFYQYFLSLADSSHFDHWSADRTAEAVNNFNKCHKQPLLHPTPSLPTAAARTQQPLHFTQVEVKPVAQGTKPSCLNLLEEIEEKKAIRTAESNKKQEGKEENWLNISNFSQFLTNSDPSKFNADLFKNFDTIITQNDTASNKSPARMSMPVVSTKREVERKRKNQSNIEGESLKSSREKEKGKNNQKDKLFKQKICEKIACRKLQREAEATSVCIAHHEMIHRIFLPDYAMYSMEVTSIKGSIAVCKRTYDDFVLLRTTLQQLYPYAKTPYLESGSWLSENDIALIKKNKGHLELFMRAILQHPLLSRLDIVANFLTIPEHKQLKAYFQGLEKETPPKGLGEIISPSGEITVDLSSEQYELISELPRWQGIFSDYFEKYGDILSTLAGQLEAIDESYSQLQKLTAEMQAILRQLTDRNTQIERQEDFEAYFRRQEQYYAGRKHNNEVEMIAITEKMIPLIMYERLNIAQFKPDFDAAQKLTEKYLRRLENEPESPCTAEEIPTIVANNRLRGNLWEESQNMQFFKLQLGYLHESLLKETHLFSNRLIDSLSRAWHELYGGNEVCEKERMSIRSCQY